MRLKRKVKLRGWMVGVMGCIVWDGEVGAGSALCVVSGERGRASKAEVEQAGK